MHTASGSWVFPVIRICAGPAAASASYGLESAAYYNSLTVGGYPTPDQPCAKAYDQYTLGCSIVSGDSITPRSEILRSAARTSHTPCADEVSRINVASALLACLRFPTPVEISLSAREGTVPPSDEEWDAMLVAATTDAALQTSADAS